jgi:hypothetical protein
VAARSSTEERGPYKPEVAGSTPAERNSLSWNGSGAGKPWRTKMFTICYRTESGRVLRHTGSERGIRELVRECELRTHWFAPGSAKFDWKRTEAKAA